MNTTTTQRYWNRPLVPMFLGILLGCAGTYALLSRQQLAPPGTPEMIAYFDESTVNTISQPASMVDARFYFAANNPGDKRAIMAPTDANGRHVPEAGATKFRLYKALSGSRAVYDQLDEPTAETLVKRSLYNQGPPWSMDCPKVELRRMTELPSCNGIGLAVLRMADGSNTFQLIPVKLASGKATIVGSSQDWLTGLPCPNFCGYPQECYLHRRP